MKGDDVARLPTYHPNDEYCSLCNDDNIVVVLNGSKNCHYCGNQINLCSWCFGVLKRNLGELPIETAPNFVPNSD